MRLFALRGSDRLGAAVASSLNVELDALEEREFSDGEHKSRPLVSVRGEDVFVLHTLHGGGQSAADRLTRLLFFIATCKENGAARVTAVTPYLAFMRKDQQTKPRDPVTSRYVAQLFDAVGTDMVVTVDVHNVAAFQNGFRHSTLLSLRNAFLPRIEALARGGRVVLLSPDTGGMRRVGLLQEAYAAHAHAPVGLAMMEKHRSGDVVTGELFAGDVEGAEVFVFDDMIASGGTMVRAAKACRERGARHVHAMATHGLMTTTSEVLFAPEIDTVTVSDSVPLSFEPGAFGKLEIVSCAPLLADAIQRLHAGGSIRRLLNPLP
ncbi:MAG: ribose-phosphate pyrophosphokinase [Devosia sp.]|uniref:ribose-phosphate diphosphokinase n=1 Tax=Devosia sp. TaxID=1871048 RepID=UPI001AD45B9D|nr:ribose-phosphate diphosphokinase [Devosia sp.]MBN9311241.1 ribose-phosphate pyrophosphokinase [Devosia sp.]MBN9316748.1 ribose-phosphate pyrophosphokinase [Devosia sp.]